MRLINRQSPREEVLLVKATGGPILRSMNYNKSMKAFNRQDNCAKVKNSLCMRVFNQLDSMVDP